MGIPQYGGIINTYQPSDTTAWTPYLGTGYAGGFAPYDECLFGHAYTTDPSVQDFSSNFSPPDYADGFMLTSYEMTDATTFTDHIRPDIYWQNLPPANGREFVASDVVYHYDEMLGLGDGFTTPDPYYSSNATWKLLLSVTSPDKLTVVFKWQTGTSPYLITTQLEALSADNMIQSPDQEAIHGTGNNWNYQIGTGPWLLTDYVSNSSITYTKNPNYWAYDERFPQNKLPYASGFKCLIIPNLATAEAAMRTGKIDAMSVTAADAANIKKTNPEIIQKQQPFQYELTLDPRNDLAPFNKLNVRIAIQHAINIPLIASSYYLGGAVAWPATLTQNQMGLAGWGLPYTQWPADVQAQYTFDPTLSKQMLATAGFPNGFNTDLILENDADQGLYQIVQSELSSVGINMSIQLMDSATWQAYILTARKQDALVARNSGILGLTTDPLRELMKYTTGYQTNYVNVSDPQIDAWSAQANIAPSVNAVKQILHDENLYIAQQHFSISLAQPYNYNLVQPWINGNPGSLSFGPMVSTAGASGACPTFDWIDKN